MKRPAVLAVWFGLASLSVAGRAHADGAVQEVARAEAQALMHDGNELVGNGEYVEALEKFRSAYAKVASPKLLLNIGTTQRLLGRNTDAAESYERFLRDPSHDTGREPEVRRILKEIDAVVGHLTVSIKTPGAKVRLDGRELGVAPVELSLRVEPGEHTVVADKPGMAAGVKAVTIGPGQSSKVAPEPSAPGLVVKTERVEVGDTQRIAGIVVGATGLAGLIAGSVLGGLALAANDEAAAHCAEATPTACTAAGVALGDDAKTKATASTIALAAGAALAGGGLTLWLTAARGPETGPASMSVSLRPLVSRERLGAALTSEW